MKLRRGDRSILDSWTRAGTVIARVAKRASIVLMAAEGKSNREIGEVVNLHCNQVSMWRKSYDEYGLAASTTWSETGTRASTTTTTC
jgi:transposase